MRALATAAAVVAVFLAELWFGEDGSTLAPRLRWAALTALLALATVWWIGRASGRRFRIIAMMACVAASVAGFVMGDREATRAYNYCVANGEEIRTQLATYRQREGHYPARLDLAIARERLCTRALRGTLLWYSATASTYQLEFGDYLVTFRSTDQAPFVAAK